MCMLCGNILHAALVYFTFTMLGLFIFWKELYKHIQYAHVFVIAVPS